MQTLTRPDPSPDGGGAALAVPWHPLVPAGCRRCHTTARRMAVRGLCDRCAIALRGTPEFLAYPTLRDLHVGRPCRRCGREDGVIQRGGVRPGRPNGYCGSCHSTLTDHVLHHGYRSLDQANAAVPYTGNRGQPASQQHAHTCAQGRAWSRQSGRLDQVGPFLPATIPALPHPPGDTTPALLMRRLRDWRECEDRERRRTWPTTDAATPRAAA